MSLFSNIVSIFGGKANRALPIIAAVLVLSLAACFGLSESEKRYNSGVTLLQEERFEEAIAELDQAILLDDSSAAAFHNRALAKDHIGRLS